MSIPLETGDEAAMRRVYPLDTVEWISLRKHLLVLTGSRVHGLLSGAVGKCKCAWSLDTAVVPSLPLGKQRGAGGANWIQLFSDRQGMAFAFPGWISQILQKLGAKGDRWTPGHGRFKFSCCSGFSAGNDWTYRRPKGSTMSTNTVMVTMRAAEISHGMPPIQTKQTRKQNPQIP